MFHLLLAFGYYYSFRKLGDISFQCHICGQDALHTVKEWWRKFHILYIPTRIVAHGYLFMCHKCKHSTGIVDAEKVQQYHDKCDAAGMLVRPSPNMLVQLDLERHVPVTPLGLLLISPLILVAVALVLFLIFVIGILLVHAIGLI